MLEYVHLSGSEDVLRAGNNIAAAAQAMTRAASTIEAALLNHERFLDDWLARLEALVSQK